MFYCLTKAKDGAIFFIMALTLEKKLQLMKSLNWDYRTSPEDMLAVLEGRLDKAGPFDIPTLLLRAMERLHWEFVVSLFGVERIKTFYTPEFARRIWPKERRKHFDFAVGILRKEPVSPPGWGTPYCEWMRNIFLSDRWNRA
jgi:hypothetical protein